MTALSFPIKQSPLKEPSLCTVPGPGLSRALSRELAVSWEKGTALLTEETQMHVFGRDGKCRSVKLPFETISPDLLAGYCWVGSGLCRQWLRVFNRTSCWPSKCV